LTHGLAAPQINAKVKALGRETMPMSPTEFDTFLAEEIANWAKWSNSSARRRIDRDMPRRDLGRTS
jgi:hypothetical protein